MIKFNNVNKTLLKRMKKGFVCSETNLFRSLTGKEEEAVTVLDNREIPEPNNDILIVCDHGSNDLKFMKPKDEEEHLIRGLDGHDPHTADFASSLSERLQCIAVMANFSRLVIDASKPVCN